jgi:predicted PurR-regulated permease PerM
MADPRPRAANDAPSPRAILRVVLIVVASALALYILYRLRTPLGYLFIALFLAVCASAPVSVLSRRMRRGSAIALVYLGIILIPVIIGAILVPPGIEAVSNLVNDLPEYAEELDETFQENDTLRSLDEDFDLTEKVQTLAEDAQGGALGSAAGTLTDVGAALVSGLFAVVTILVLSMFIVARGPQWLDAALRTRPKREAEVLRRALLAMADAVSSYVAGALLQAFIAGTISYVVLELLGVPAPLALAVIIAILDLIPLVGATIGAVIVGLITLFTDFPTVTIIWAAFAIGYQQFENYVIQPRIQSRAVDLDPFVVVIAALFGGTLFGIIGALVAIPVAAAIQIGVVEFLRYRREARAELAAAE